MGLCNQKNHVIRWRRGSLRKKEKACLASLNLLLIDNCYSLLLSAPSVTPANLALAVACGHLFCCVKPIYSSMYSLLFILNNKRNHCISSHLEWQPFSSEETIKLTHIKKFAGYSWTGKYRSTNYFINKAQHHPGTLFQLHSIPVLCLWYYKKGRWSLQEGLRFYWDLAETLSLLHIPFLNLLIESTTSSLVYLFYKYFWSCKAQRTKVNLTGPMENKMVKYFNTKTAT